MDHISYPELPPDVLSEIFSLCAFIVRDRQTQAYIYDGSATLRAISQVCTLWRDLAISDASIWAQVVEFAGGKNIWREEVLRRTQARPVSATIFWPSSKASPHRLGSLPYKEIVFHIDPSSFKLADGSMKEHIISSITSFIEGSSKTLTSISVHFPQDVLPAIDPFPVIAGSDLTGRLPRLHHLQLTGCSFNFRALLFQKLTSLDIAIFPPRSWNPALFVQALQGMPALISLRMHDTESNVGGRVGDAYSFIIRRSQVTVELPQLSILFLSGSLDVITHLLEVINKPPTCSVSILSSLLSSTRMLPEIRQIIRDAMREWPPQYHVGWYISTPYSDMTTLSSLHQGTNVRLGSFTLTMKDAHAATFLSLIGASAQVLRLESDPRIFMVPQDLFSDFSSITTLVYPDASVIKFLRDRMSDNMPVLLIPRLNQILLNDCVLSNPDFTSLLDKFLELRRLAELPTIQIDFFGRTHTEYVSGLNLVDAVLPMKIADVS
ncbi:hypothetical protein GALMADRAFT_245919 [Galerina marginata CBS 339.88]|uniref:Uncharacterized protein n=1 Tax=Galerina marginata (strain CBS 339.88) TaxID=685588 RepID=A0A067T3Q3_GALM3|nr:hypothetical protein GALMADRAFT_245919 [Galerina marginata CBS 339.88]